MAGKRSRNKDMAAENELCRLLSEHLGIPVSRSLESPREGGADILDVPHLAIEVKRNEVININKWWEQAVDQAGKYDPARVPVLFYRQNMKPWVVVVPIFFINPELTRSDISIAAHYRCKMPVDFETFCNIYKIMWGKKLKTKGK